MLVFDHSATYNVDDHSIFGETVVNFFEEYGAKRTLCQHDGEL